MKSGCESLLCLLKKIAIKYQNNVGIPVLLWVALLWIRKALPYFDICSRLHLKGIAFSACCIDILQNYLKYKTNISVS